MDSASKLVIGNWKSNFSWQQAQTWAQRFAELRSHNHEYVICPPFPLLAALQNQSFALGVQDLSPFEAGAYTGAVTPLNLEGLNVQYVLLGHSERRKFFGETSQDVARKVDLALAHNLVPIVCADQPQFAEQAAALGENAQHCFIAYEPVHSISTFGGQEDPLETTLSVVQEAARLFSSRGVLYGGSVSPENSLAYLTVPSIAGILVGGSSLKPDVFAKI